MKKQATSVMLLFLYAMMIAALLILVVVGARLYGRALDARDDHASRRLALSYVQSQAAGFSAERVKLNAGPEGTMLCLRERQGGYETRIYLYNGSLRSEFCPVDSVCDPRNSEKICSLNAFDLWEESGLLYIDADGSIGYVFCSGGKAHG